MAACGSIQRIFEKPLPENPTLLESLSSWNQIKPIDQQPSFTEIFGELHFNENITIPQSPSSTFKVFNPQIQNNTSFKLFGNGSTTTTTTTNDHENDISSSTSLPSPKTHKKSESFCLNSESLQLCTEGLGFESSDDVEDMNNEMNQKWESKENNRAMTTTVTVTKHSTMENLYGELKRSRAFPPPISCIGRSGKPLVCLKSYREDGRFVLKQVRIPTQEVLHACREDGRLKLQFVQPSDDDVLEEDEFDEEDDDDDEEEEEEEEEELIDDDIDED